MLTLNGAVSNCRSLGAGDANVDDLSSHPRSQQVFSSSRLSASVALPMALYKYAYDYDYDYVTYEPPRTVLTTIWTSSLKSRPLVCQCL